jgi:serine/threonine-protein kinase
VGTPRNKVETALGKPTRDVSGSWKTRAVTYSFVPNQIDLGYLFDRNTGVLRQTELSFTQSVDPQMALKALDQLLESRITEDIKQGFQQVQQRRRSAYTFTNGSFRGQIVRQDCDFVYISIWNANLHDFEVEGARKC